jgi:phenylacetate-CoA oxygenase PaaI subunit
MTAEAALARLLLALADNKRLLGIRYSDWILGAPSIEAAIAASSMAQDEWGHSRLTYALLADLGNDPRALEHERPAEAYASWEGLDAAWPDWFDVLAANLLFDAALAESYAALGAGGYGPARSRIQKMLDEEAYHREHALGWVETLRRGTAVAVLRDRLTAWLPAVARWFGREEDPGWAELRQRGWIGWGPEEMRARWLATVAPALERVGVPGVEPRGGAWALVAPLDWSGWDPTRRRAAPGGPDPDTLARVRGDRNRALLVE